MKDLEVFQIQDQVVGRVGSEDKMWFYCRSLVILFVGGLHGAKQVLLERHRHRLESLTAPALARQMPPG